MGIKVAIDAGHGSNTAGKRTPKLPDNTVILEHIANVGVAHLLDKELSRCGFTTVRVAWDDTDGSNDRDVPLSVRQAIVKSNKCDYVISIHFNAFGDDSSFNDASGVGIYIHHKNAGDSKKLATTVQKYLIQGTKQKDRGVTPEVLAMCNCTAMGVKAAILPELAFMTNLHEATTMVGNPAFWKECAIEIAKGLCEYCRVPYIAEVAPSRPVRVTRDSSAADIMWLQNSLKSLVNGFTIDVTGVYTSNTRAGVILYWEQLGWGKHMNDDGTEAGKSTTAALAEGRRK